MSGDRPIEIKTDSNGISAVTINYTDRNGEPSGRAFYTRMPDGVFKVEGIDAESGTEKSIISGEDLEYKIKELLDEKHKRDPNGNHAIFIDTTQEGEPSVSVNYEKANDKLDNLAVLAMQADARRAVKESPIIAVSDSGKVAVPLIAELGSDLAIADSLAR